MCEEYYDDYDEFPMYVKPRITIVEEEDDTQILLNRECRRKCEDILHWLEERKKEKKGKKKLPKKIKL